MQTSDIFSQACNNQFEPLASRMRPRCLNEYVGQAHLLEVGKPLFEAINKGQLHSMILWGPPGVGKTSLAKLLAQEIEGQFIALSAVLSGVKDIRDAVKKSREYASQYQQKTLLFIDEVHRFNKAQQDAFLPFVEDGTFVFVGATTENPSFELNNALLSRCHVYVLKRLNDESLKALIQRAITEDKGLANKVELSKEAVELLVKSADGDARRALNLLEISCDLPNGLFNDTGDVSISTVSVEAIKQVIKGDVRQFDKGGDIFYEQISALHKSMRGSDPDACLYWLACMLEGGCDPLYIARRVVRMASEDVGNADPRALDIALNAWDVQHRLGHPEGQLAIAQALVYLAAAPKSNAVYNAYNSAMADAKKLPSYNVPMHLRNAPTSLMKNLNYGADYRYTHNETDAYAAGEKYFPDEIDEKQYYFPVERGLEIKIAEKLKHLRELTKVARNK